MVDPFFSITKLWISEKQEIVFAILSRFPPRLFLFYQYQHGYFLHVLLQFSSIVAFFLGIVRINHL